MIANQAVDDGGLVDRVQWRVSKILTDFQGGKNGTNCQNVKKGYTNRFISNRFSGQKQPVNACITAKIKAKIDNYL